MLEKFDRRDTIFLAVCTFLFLLLGFFGVRWFPAAFPESSIDFRYDRQSSRALAHSFVTGMGFEVSGWKHASEFGYDEEAKIFLERNAGLERAGELMREVEVWYWRHRWFRPLQQEEFRVRISPGGELVAWQHLIPEELALPSLEEADARALGEQFLTSRAAVDPSGLRLVSASRRQLPKRSSWIFVWESERLRPAGAGYRHEVTIDGNRIGAYRQWLNVPEAWLREYRQLRSKNSAAGAVDSVLLALTLFAALVVFIVRLRRGDIRLRYTVGIGIVSFILVAGVALNSFPSALASYDTTTSYPAFIAREITLALLQALSMAVLLMVIVAPGEALYRERFPRHLAIPRLFALRALRSKRVFNGFVLGFTLVAAFLAYQVGFYLVAESLGAWAPADIPYDDILNTAFPWIAVLFVGFFPAFSEEYLSRAFSIPLFEKLFRSAIVAVVVAGFIWGFGHATYPNQPFYIRGVEVGIVGIIVGVLLFRFGLLPLLVWHYTVDALYTSLLLFRSDNTYYIVSAAIASALFALPLVASLFLYFRHGGFEPDDDLENRAIGTVRPVETLRTDPPSALPPPKPLRRWLALLAAASIAVALVLFPLLPAGLSSVVNYTIDAEAAETIARAEIGARAIEEIPEYRAAWPAAGFRAWNEAGRNGGRPGSYFQTAARTIAGNAGLERLIEIQRDEVEAATWVVRFFTPLEKEEHLVEIDPRDRRVVGFAHELPEAAPGRRLEQREAESIARQSFIRFGLDPGRFDLREALSFPQPNRLDWLLHFQEREPLAAEAHRRVSVRIAGGTISQFAKTVRVPERVVREAEQTRIVDIVVVVLKLAAFLLLAGGVIFAVIVASRDHGFRWQRPLRLTALLAPVALAWPLLDIDAILRNYDTSLAFETWMVIVISSTLMMVAALLGSIFLALASIETLIPAAPRLLSRDGRARFGRSGLVAAAAALGLIAIFSMIESALPSLLPSLYPPRPLAPPAVVGSAVPALAVLWRATVAAIVGSAVVAALAFLVAASGRRRAAVAGFVLVAIAILLAPMTLREALPVVVAVVATLLFFVIARYILGDHPLAWPVAIFGLVASSGIATLVGNERIDLMFHAVVVAIVLVAGATWLAAPKRTVSQPDDGQSAAAVDG